MPLTTAPGSPPGTPSRHLYGVQRWLATAHALRLVLGPPRPHHVRPGNTGDGPSLPAPWDGWLGEGKRLKPDAPHNVERSSPPGRPPTTPAARSPLHGMQAKGTVPGPHARTPAPTTRGPQTPTARPEGAPPGEDEPMT